MDNILLNSVYDYIDEIKNSDDYKKLKYLDERIKKELNDLICDYKNKQEKYESIREYHKYYKDYNKICNEYSLAKEKLYNNELVIEYKKYENNIKEKLIKLSDELNNVLR